MMRKRMCISRFYCGLEDLFNRKEKEVTAKRAKCIFKIHLAFLCENLSALCG